MKMNKKAECELYKQFILAYHGPQVLDRLKREYAVEATNALLAINNPKEFEQKRIEYAINGYQPYTQPND